MASSGEEEKFHVIELDGDEHDFALKEKHTGKKIAFHETEVKGEV